MAWLVPFLINLAVKYALPSLEASLGSKVVQLIQDLFSHIGSHPNPAQAVSQVEGAHAAVGISSKH